MGNPVVHFELMSNDPARIGDFYQRLFGWKVTPRPKLDPEGRMLGLRRPAQQG